MTDPRDRDDPPGATFTEEVTPPMLVDFTVESAAAHSRSQGWLPVVTLQLIDDNGVEFKVFIPVGSDLERIVTSMVEAARRAILDAEAAERAGIAALADDDEADDE